MAAKGTSAGILLHRRGDAGVEVLLVHPGGPFWARKDEGAWSIPKGEYGADEEPQAAAIRELAEELGIALKEACLAPLTFASHTYATFHLLMPLYICRRWDGFVQALEGQALKWVRPRQLRDYPMPPADEPLIPAIIDILGCG